MSISKQEVLSKVCYTELVYGRINKKLHAAYSKNQIEQLIQKWIDGAVESSFKKIGKNYYIENKIYNVKVTVNSSTFRVITVNKNP